MLFVNRHLRFRKNKLFLFKEQQFEEKSVLFRLSLLVGMLFLLFATLTSFHVKEVVSSARFPLFISKKDLWTNETNY